MTLKLEIGKTYLTSNGGKVKIVSDEYRTPWNMAFKYIGVYLAPDSGSNHFKDDGYCTNGIKIVKEYHEPVVHRRDIVWWKNEGSEHIEVSIMTAGAKAWWGGPITELKRETVEYEEKE